MLRRYVLDLWETHWLRSSPLAVHFYRYPSLWCVAAYVGGLSLAKFVAIDLLWLLLAAIGLVVGSITAIFRGWRLPAQLGCGVAFLVFGMANSQLQQPPLGDSLSSAAKRESAPVAIRAVIASTASWRPNANHRPADPKSEAWRTRWEIDCRQVMVDGAWQVSSARSSVSVDGRVDDLLPGDIVTIYGSFRAITPATNPGEVDFSKQMQKKHQFWSVEADGRSQIECIGVESTYSYSRILGVVRRSVDRWLANYITGGNAPLAAALVLGQREQVDWLQQEQLMATGTLHLLAISGLHVEIVAGAVALLCVLVGLSARPSCVVLVLTCAAYAALAGGKPPVLRAVLIVASLSLCRAWGRNARMGNILATAGLVLLFARASNLENIGVQLSFLAVTTICIFAPRPEETSSMTARVEALIDSSRTLFSQFVFWVVRFCISGLQISAWVWLVTCPLIWVHFHVVSPISVLLNVVIAIPLSISLLAGLLTGVFGWLAPLGVASGWICGKGLSLIGWVIHWGELVPLGHWWLPAPSNTWIVSFYVVVIGWLLVLGKRRKWLLAVILVGMIAGEVAQSATGPRGFAGHASVGTDDQSETSSSRFGSELRCTFVDVGHGTSVVLEMPTGEVWLYDAGRMGNPTRSFESIASVLWKLPTARIDTLLISHADADHYNATEGLLKRFAVGRVVSTSQFWHSRDLPAIRLRQALARRGTVTETWAASLDRNLSTQGDCGGARWQVLHPSRDWLGKTDNADSLCLLLEFAGIRILLPGDLEADGFAKLVQLPPRHCHVLMAPHHGSSSLDPAPMLDWCRPRWTVISGNQRAMRDRVLRLYGGRTRHLAVTFRDGATQFRIAGDGTLRAFHWEGESWEEFPP